MPSQYQRNKAALNHFVSVNNETEYRDTLADRGTPLGDQMTQGTSPTFAYGSPGHPGRAHARERTACTPTR